MWWVFPPLGLKLFPVELEGTNYEIGRQYGRKCGNIIKDCITLNYRITNFYTGLSRDDCVRAVARHVPALIEYVPHLYEEMRGIADGSGLRFEDVLAHNFHGRDLLGGCTMIHVAGNLTENGHTITAQTIDWNPQLQPFYHVLRLRPDNAPQMLMFTLAGIIGLVGRNLEGVNVFMNILLTNEEIQTGVPAYPLLRSALESPSVLEAVSRLRGVKRCSPFNYLISDDEGEAINIEASADHFLTQQITNGYYVHTNHCLCEPLRSFDVYATRTESDETFRRWGRAAELLAQKTEGHRLSVQDIFQMLQDHQNYPDSICRHPAESVAPEGQMGTVGAVVAEQHARHLWVVWGNPCQNAPQQLHFQA